MGVVAFLTVVPGPLPLDGFVHVRRVAARDGIDAASSTASEGENRRLIRHLRFPMGVAARHGEYSE